MALKDLKLENLPRSAKILLFAALAACLVAVFYFYYMKDTLQQRTALLQDVRRLEVAVAQGKAIESQHQRFKKELAFLEDRLNKLRSVLPGGKETPEILKSIQYMARMSSLKITKFTPQAIVPRAFYADWPIQIEVQGSYNALGYFFEKVSQANRLINVDSLTAKGIEGSTDTARTLTAVCTATTFVFREDLVVDTADASSKPVPTKQERKR